MLRSAMAVAGLAAAAGAAAAPSPEAVGSALSGTHYGEIWWDCLRSWLGGCHYANDAPIPAAPPCFAFPAHWALYIWTGNSARVTVGVGFVQTWTESHYGGWSWFTTEGGVFTGSFCVEDHGDGVTVRGDGVFQETD